MKHQVFILLFNLVIVTLGSHFEDCAPGWKFYSFNANRSCLWLSDSSTSYLSDANSSCAEKNASLIIIDTEEKYRRIKQDFVIETGVSVRLGITIEDNELNWMTQDGPIPVKNVPRQIRNVLRTYHQNKYNYNYNDGLIMNSNGVHYDNHYRSSSSRYICEKRTTCKSGWYGLECDRECHCHEEECDPTSLEVTCSFGCQVGWMGHDCSQKKEDAEIKFFCVNSDDQGKYAHIIIETKGVLYENINPVDDDGEWISWCNNTVVYNTNDTNTTHIKIFVNNSIDQNINDRQCAGKISESGNYEWKLKIQERNGLVSRNDQEYSVECNFADGDNLLLSGETEIKRESLFRKSDIRRPMKYLEEKKENVQLEVIDPSNDKPVSEIVLGTPVAIKITFAINEDNIATGIRPYNCKASSPDGKKEIMFLDKYGCAINDFPISEFHKAGPKTIVTKPFPLFGFGGTKEIEFHCSYSLCFGTEHCSSDCARGVVRFNRYRRSTKERTLVKRSVRILQP